MLVKLIDFLVVKVFGRVGWSSIKYFLTGRDYDLSDGQIDRVVKILEEQRCIVLTKRNSHLSSWLVSIAHFLLTLRKGPKAVLAKYTHVLMHVEKGLNLDIIESAGRGVQRVSFYRAFCVDEICVLKPKHMTEDEMELAVELANSYLGTLYDSIFNLSDDNRMSCVELIYRAMMRVNPASLPNLNAMIFKYGNLTPQMFYDCGDFEVLLEMKGVQNDFPAYRK